MSKQDYDKHARRLKAIIKVLKKKYTNLTAEEAIDLATDIINASDSSEEEQPF